MKAGIWYRNDYLVIVKMKILRKINSLSNKMMKTSKKELS